MSFFNILNSFFRKDKNEVYLPNYFLNIPNEVLKFMYLKNGPKKNIDTYTDEPSAIDINLPISENLHNLEKLSYYPSYETLKPTELPFTIAHEIGHVLNGEADVLYFSGFNNHSKIEMRANRQAIKLLLEYCNCHDLSLEPVQFLENFGIPGTFEDLVKEESARYYLG